MSSTLSVQSAISFSIILQCIFILFVPTSNCIRTHYDFIVVGSGAGGSVVARRLAEDGQYTVLLVESGGNPRLGYDVPANVPLYTSDPGVTFRYQSVPQKNAALSNNGVVSVVSGRMLGGTTALNYMYWNRGNERDMNHWANVTGDESWAYNNMLKYMKRSESYEGNFPSDQHGYNGPITVSRPRYAPGLHDYWLPAGQELGYPIGDPNGPQRRGFSPVEFSKSRGRRVSSFVGYVRPILNFTPNLEVAMNTNVTEILFQENQAVGVRIHSNELRNLPPGNCLYAAKEVILSAGTYNSPLLLQRSGVGPSSVLRAAGIPIVKDLPVGRNFQDHPAVVLSYAINNASVVKDEDRDLTPQAWELYQSHGDGPYSDTRGGNGQAFISSSIAASEGNADWPDLHLYMGHSVQPILPIEYDTPGSQNLSEDEVPMSVGVFMGRPKSRGSIQINPNDIYGSPIFDPGYFNDFRDMQIFIDGINETLKIYEQTQVYKRLKTRLIPARLPPCQRFPVRSYSYWKCFVQHILQGGCHPAGTNKMGRLNDPTAVVDTELRVIGTEHLRVVDASVMPFITNANPQAVVYGIAEKASEMILRTWKGKSKYSYSTISMLKT